MPANTALNTGFPTTPIVDPETGELTQAWRWFLVQLFNRTGGSIGYDLGAGRQPCLAVNATASPLAYMAPTDGVFYCTGGGIISMTLQRGTSAAYPIAAFYSGVKMAAGDNLVVSFVQSGFGADFNAAQFGGLPSFVFFPG